MSDYFDQEEENQALRLSELSSEEFDREVRGLDQTKVDTTSDKDAGAHKEEQVSLIKSNSFATLGPDDARQAFEDIKLNLATLQSLQAELPADIYEEQVLQLLYQLNLQREALESSAVEEWQVVESGASLLKQAMETEGVELPDKSLAALRASADNIPDRHPDKPSRLNDLGIGFRTRFERVGDIGDLERGIDANRRAVDLTPDGHPNKSSYLSNLGNSFRTRFERVGDIGDLERAIDASRRAVVLTPDGHPDKPAFLNSLGNGFIRRFERVGDIGDLERAIDTNRRAVDLTPDGHPNKPGHLNSLGTGFLIRFEHVGNIGDLECAIDVSRRAVDLTPDGHPNKPIYLNNLGNGFIRRFDRVGDIGDLERAINANRHAVNLTPDGHPNKPVILNTLGVGFKVRFERVGDIGDLERAIDTNCRAVDLIPNGHPDKPTILSTLGAGFKARFEHVGDIGDLELAIDANRRAIDLTPSGHPDMANRLNNLGNSFRIRFQHVGDIGDLERAIDANCRAVDLTPNGHPNKPAILSNLGNGFFRRFQHVGDIGDLERAIDANHRAVDLTPDGHPHKSTILNTLGVGFRTRFELVGDIRYLERAIDANRRAVDLTPDGHTSKPSHLNNLGAGFLTRFERVGNIGDLECAIDVSHRTVDLTSDGHPDKPGYLNNLGNGFFRRFQHVGDVGDLEHAINAHRCAVDLTPDGHLNKPAFLNNLGKGFRTRFERVSKPTDFQHSLQVYLRAADQESGPPSIRLDAVKESANMCWLGLQRGFVTHHDLVNIYERAISLIPQVAWLGNSVGQRFERLTEIGRLVNGAVAATIAAGQPTKAVEWLDQGRGVVWGQLLQLRSPLDDLHAIRPDLAEELQSVSQALENSAGLSADHQSLQDEAADRVLQKEASDRIRLAGERDRVLKTIRNIDGFERFLMPKLYSTLARASKGGPVILINVHESRCDALVVYSVSEDPTHVFLSKLSQKDVTDMHQQLLDVLWQAGVRGRGNRDRGAKPYRFFKANFSDILSRLWLLVVHPILEAIEHKLYGSIIDVLPHVTWCATGPLAFLPLHAAGEYGREDGSKIFDFVVSSYTPTLSMLLQTSASIADLRSTSNKILVVSQPQTPGFISLPESLIEVAKIRVHFSEAQVIHRNDADGTVSAVLGVIHEHRPQCIHFACHGVQDADDPTGSAFFLHDGKLELRQLMGTSTTGAALAFLSACQTAKGDVKLPEEAVHLAAGMLAVGYRSVVGTLWSIKDKDAPVVADEFYRRLKGDEENGSVGDGRARVAYALHGATEVLRKQVGESEFLRWAAFVHLGQ